MKLKRSQLKEILKESILELLSEGNVEIKLSNDINLIKAKNKQYSKNYSTKETRPAQGRKVHNPNRVVNENKRVKVKTGNSMFDDLINSAKSESDMLSDRANNTNQSPAEKMDYSNFVDDMHR